MDSINFKNYWDKIYNKKLSNEVSWFQEKPEVSLGFFNTLNIDINSSIIDIGGGDGNLVDYLLQMGFKNITVLDISENAINKSKLRLGKNSKKVNWIVSDILKFKPNFKYDLWHDRAAFHFITRNSETEKYVEICNESLKSTGKIIVGTFSDKGPDKCSGLDVVKYSQDDLTNKFNNSFEKIKCINTIHKTPFNTIQDFTFCSFKKKLA